MSDVAHTNESYNTNERVHTRRERDVTRVRMSRAVYRKEYVLHTCCKAHIFIRNYTYIHI